jgi:hypothetical protein
VIPPACADTCGARAAATGRVPASAWPDALPPPASATAAVATARERITVRVWAFGRLPFTAKVGDFDSAGHNPSASEKEAREARRGGPEDLSPGIGGE